MHIFDRFLKAQLTKVPVDVGAVAGARAQGRQRLPIDVTVCPTCRGRMKVIAAVTELASIRHYLEGVGLPARPQLEFETGRAAGPEIIRGGGQEPA